MLASFLFNILETRGDKLQLSALIAGVDLGFFLGGGAPLKNGVIDR